MVNLGTGCAILIVNLGTVFPTAAVEAGLLAATAVLVVALRMVSLGTVEAVVSGDVVTSPWWFMRRCSLGMTSSCSAGSSLLLTTGTGVGIGLIVILGEPCTWLANKLLTSGDCPPSLITVRIGSRCRLIFRGSTFRGSPMSTSASSGPRISIMGLGEVDREEDCEEPSDEEDEEETVTGTESGQWSCTLTVDGLG